MTINEQKSKTYDDLFDENVEGNPFMIHSVQIRPKNVQDEPLSFGKYLIARDGMIQETTRGIYCWVPTRLVD
jgi:hypothetical protein